MRKHQFYIAGPLFTEAELNFNLALNNILVRNGYKVFLPQLTPDGTPSDIFDRNLKNLMDSDIVIAICDGADMDSGTAWECGKFYGHGYIYALRTDFRKSGDDPDTGINLMIGQSATRIFTDRIQLTDWISNNIKPKEK